MDVMRPSPWSPPPLPRQHGAWAMLAMPLVLGLAAARSLHPGALLAIAAMLLTFLARSAAVPAGQRLLRRRPASWSWLGCHLVWTVLWFLAGTAALAGAVLLAPAATRMDALAVALLVGVLGASHSAAALLGRERRLLFEVLGMSGLALAAALVLTVSGQPLSGAVLGVALLAWTYDLSTLAHIRARRREGWRRTACLATQVLLGLAIALAWARGWLPPLALLVWTPLVLRGLWARLQPPADLRDLGLRELRISTAFTLLAVAAYLV